MIPMAAIDNLNIVCGWEERTALLQIGNVKSDESDLPVALQLLSRY